jgi:DNA repair protein RadA/Sms
MMKTKTIFVCQNCGAQRPRWEGRCTECGSWNSFVEETLQGSDAKSSRKTSANLTALALDRVAPLEPTKRYSSGIAELDRVLGGGLVPGSFVLLGGDPGIGKSTLLLQMAGGLAAHKQTLLYISAEESIEQTADRGRRLGIRNVGVHIANENNLETILSFAESEKPDVLVVDSIQTVFLPDLSSAPGSVSQVRECAGRLMMFAKNKGISVILIGHVTKEGTIAGPKVLEHLVDTVLSFEGDRNHQFRILRAIKNRFGPTHELGVFQMQSEGLIEVSNPSELFLEERGDSTSGSVVFASMEGTRPLLCEIQALTTSSPLPMPRRTAIGIDVNRLHLLIAVLDRHADVGLSHADVFINVVGGLKLIETASDLAVAAALISSERRTDVDAKACFFGEIGLTGEIRGVPFVEHRLREAAHLGFEKFFVPQANKRHLDRVDKDLIKKIIWVKQITDLMSHLKIPAKKQRAPARPAPDLDQ